MSVATVLLSTPASAAAPDLRRLVTQTGFALAEHRLGSAPAVDFGSVAVAVIDVGDSPDIAAAQTRRWRAELGDRVLPVVWVAAPDLVTAGLDAGADVVLARPVEAEVFVAQLRAMGRVHSIASKVAARANESRLLGDQLRKALVQLDREYELTRRVRATFLPRALPSVGGARVHVSHRPRGRTGGDFYDARRLDEHHIGFFVGDVIGPGAGLLGVFVQQSIVMKEIDQLGYRVVPPDEILMGVNRHLLALGADDLPLVALLAGVLNTQSGELVLARAGLPPAVHVPTTGEPTAWAVPGPFLGAANTTYQPFRATLGPGDRLLIGTDGTRPDGDPGPTGTDGLLGTATAHRALIGPEFADAVARELLRHVRHTDDFTLLCVEMRPEAP